MSRDCLVSVEKYIRPLFCPICGQALKFETDAMLPEVYRLPEHESANGMNICAALVVTVTLSLDKCRKCERGISKHPSGLCRTCFGEEYRNLESEG